MLPALGSRLFLLPHCLGFRFPPGRGVRERGRASVPAAAAMWPPDQEPDPDPDPAPARAGRSPPGAAMPGLRALLPARAYLCSLKGRLLLAESDFLRCVTAALIYFAISITAVAKYSDGASKAAGKRIPTLTLTEGLPCPGNPSLMGLDCCTF
ncbi:CKLF-like MARVEL transmembrane domain-containing protein 3 isoform X3 [Acinonyx jubatus]|uniref:CKLF-like MARVEL transmembrane domain-containing protein 3 isoform X3 n=1 Tax=Acinonyx jubatus TaxID=32536 RepID=A0ABM3P4U1_ACIJB|nr:CKLF-like MARVEL transmembrane domain-containing protein 3 isoform X3 [Acinonyx jubatus]